MASDKVYRTIAGFVQFPPREGEAGGKDIRNISVRQTGFKEQAVMVSGTLWPSHAAVDVQEGDFVVFEGSYSQNKGQKQDGSSVTYHNISISRISVNGGPAESGEKPETVNDTPSEAAADDDEIPF